MNNEQPSDNELVRYIAYSGESDNIDAKGPTCWDGGVESAKFAKDIAAFANSRDGGVIVVGKEEPSPGQFVLKGLTPQQADSFDSTKVAAWINNRFSPPIRLVCHRQEHDGRAFIVITVAEFDDVPVMCIKSYQDPQNAKTILLKERTIYVRTANAESAPLGCVEELRSLIGLAVRKRGDELLSTFNAMLKGRSLVEAPSDDEQFDREISEVMPALNLKTSDPDRPGAWCMWFHPGKYDRERWPERETLESLVRKHAVRLANDFPPYYRGTHPREWGIANDLYGEVWTLTHSGLFIFYKQFRENKQPYRIPWMDPNGQEEPTIQPGMWIEYEWSMWIVVQLFMFMARMASECDPDRQCDTNCRLVPSRDVRSSH